MKDLYNIEKSAFRRGEYVGYAQNLVWHIKKSNSSYGTWEAFPAPNKGYHVAIAACRLYGFRLAEMSAKLAAWQIPAHAR